MDYSQRYSMRRTITSVMAYEPRTYRRRVDPAGLVTFQVVVRETDLQIAADTDLSGLATALVRACRKDLEHYISRNPVFATSFVPVEVGDDAPSIVRAMAEAARLAGVGPMAAVAGAVAEYVARGLAAHSRDVIVENGGDVFLIGEPERTLAVHAGPSPLSGRIGIVLPAGSAPVGVCTSSATVGPSVSLGSADAACVVADTGALADAVASALGNRVHGEGGTGAAIDAVRGTPGVRGLVVVIGETLAAWGDLQVVPLGPTP